MNRIDKITRLVAVGYNASELSRSSNDSLNALYIEAGPRLRAQDSEVQRVIRQEQGRARAMHRETSERQRFDSLTSEWNRKWKPMPPICTVAADVSEIMESIRGYKNLEEEQKSLFRKTGHKRYADAANKAKRSMQHLQGQLLHLSEEVK